MAVGALFLIGAVVSVLLIGSPEEQSDAAAPPAEGNYPEVARVDLVQAKGAYDAGAAVFVDVRDKVYYDGSHIPGAISIPLSEIENRLDELDPDDWIILYCT